MKKLIIACLVLAVGTVTASVFDGCYSFTGASVPPHLKTIAIPLFDDQSGSGEPTLREQLTDKLQESFRKDNNFQLADRRTADALLEGVIMSMQNEPAIVQKGESVSKNRITVNVKVTYRDQKLKKLIWEKQFSRYADYEISKGPSAKSGAITTAIEQVVEDILLDTVSGW